MCFQPTCCRQKKALDLSVASCGYIGRVHFLSHEIPFLHNEPPYEHIDAIPHVNVLPVALHDANAPSAISLDVALSLLSGVWAASGAFLYFYFQLVVFYLPSSTRES